MRYFMDSMEYTYADIRIDMWSQSWMATFKLKVKIIE